MDGSVSRRHLLGVAAGGATAGLAGCFGLFSCEKGDRTIEDLAGQLDERAGEEVGVKGRLASLDQELAVVDDGTGQAGVTPGPLAKWDTESMDSGACVSASGRLIKPGSKYDQDVVLFNGTVVRND